MLAQKPIQAIELHRDVLPVLDITDVTVDSLHAHAEKIRLFPVQNDLSTTFTRT
jgi:hypothetical protein